MPFFTAQLNVLIFSFTTYGRTTQNFGFRLYAYIYYVFYVVLIVSPYVSASVHTDIIEAPIKTMSCFFFLSKKKEKKNECKIVVNSKNSVAWLYVLLRSVKHIMLVMGTSIEDSSGAHTLPAANKQAINFEDISLRTRNTSVLLIRNTKRICM